MKIIIGFLGFFLSLFVLILLNVINKEYYKIDQFFIGWASCATYYTVINWIKEK
jgi:hypothetical protein